MSPRAPVFRMPPPTRIPPKLPVAAMKTYAIRQQPDRQVKTACELANCGQWAKGWETFLNEADPAHAEAADWIRRHSGRTFTESRSGGLTVFRFEAGQRCFKEHRTHPQRFVERGGDWRGNPRRDLIVHARPANWQESFAEHQDRLAEQVKRG